MAKHESDAEYWAKQDEQRRELEELFARMRERLRRLSFGLLSRT